jgi:hypothetical protein
MLESLDAKSSTHACPSERHRPSSGSSGACSCFAARSRDFHRRQQPPGAPVAATESLTETMCAHIGFVAATPSECLRTCDPNRCSVLHGETNEPQEVHRAVEAREDTCAEAPAQILLSTVRPKYSRPLSFQQMIFFSMLHLKTYGTIQNLLESEVPQSFQFLGKFSGRNGSWILPEPSKRCSKIAVYQAPNLPEWRVFGCRGRQAPRAPDALQLACVTCGRTFVPVRLQFPPAKFQTLSVCCKFSTLH